MIYNLFKFISGVNGEALLYTWVLSFEVHILLTLLLHTWHTYNKMKHSYFVEFFWQQKDLTLDVLIISEFRHIKSWSFISVPIVTHPTNTERELSSFNGLY